MESQEISKYRNSKVPLNWFIHPPIINTATILPDLEQWKAQSVPVQGWTKQYSNAMAMISCLQMISGMLWSSQLQSLNVFASEVNSERHTRDMHSLNGSNNEISSPPPPPIILFNRVLYCMCVTNLLSFLTVYNISVHGHPQIPFYTIMGLWYG